MPEYRIAPDQGVCPEGHPCHLSPGLPAFRECDTPHRWGRLNPESKQHYMGAALLDVYAGPVGVEAYTEACEGLRDLIKQHEEQHRTCPGVEVCTKSREAAILRAIQDVLDPLPRGSDPDALHCDLCPKVETAADLTADWNGETGNHLSCEASR